MPRQFVEFPPDLDQLIRKRVAKECRIKEALQPSRLALRGTRVTFYRNVWLAYLEPYGPKAEVERMYFLARPGARKDRIVPLANTAGSVDRANRRYKLQLTKENLVDYLNFYYAFTPKDDPILSRLPEGRTQFSVPQTVQDLRFAATEEVDTEAACSDQCLAYGAVWHFLDEETHSRIVPHRFKSRHVSPFAVSGRSPIQFRHALFATDFRVPQTTGIPVLSNPELLFQSDALVEPTILAGPTLRDPRSLVRKEWWHRIVAQMAVIGSKVGHRALQALWWLFALSLLYFWGCSALFSVFEWAGWGLIRAQFEWWTPVLHMSDWRTTGLIWTAAAIVAFAWLIVLTTHRDKVFNWIFRLCPRPLASRVTAVLDYYVTLWDRTLIAQDTFRKRALWCALHLVVWMGYMILAFASLQILLGLALKQPSGTAVVVAETLLLQALLNLPFVAFVLIQGFGLIEWLDPVAEGVVNYWLLASFQIVMATVVFRGLYRVWVFTVEASPYTFFRRLRHNPNSRRRRR